MDNYKQAIDLICRYEGFNELAYTDPQTGVEPYPIGFGTQYYPDGSVVKKTQCCTQRLLTSSTCMYMHTVRNLYTF